MAEGERNQSHIYIGSNGEARSYTHPGGGGGKPDLAMAGGKDASKVPDVIAQAPAIVEGLL